MKREIKANISILLTKPRNRAFWKTGKENTLEVLASVQLDLPTSESLCFCWSCVSSEIWIACYQESRGRSLFRPEVALSFPWGERKRHRLQAVDARWNNWKKWVESNAKADIMSVSNQSIRFLVDGQSWSEPSGPFCSWNTRILLQAPCPNWSPGAVLRICIWILPEILACSPVEYHNIQRAFWMVPQEISYVCAELSRLDLVSTIKKQVWWNLKENLHWISDDDSSFSGLWSLVLDCLSDTRWGVCLPGFCQERKKVGTYRAESISDLLLWFHQSSTDAEMSALANCLISRQNLSLWNTGFTEVKGVMRLAWWDRVLGKRYCQDVSCLWTIEQPDLPKVCWANLCTWNDLAWQRHRKEYLAEFLCCILW